MRKYLLLKYTIGALDTEMSSAQSYYSIADYIPQLRSKPLSQLFTAEGISSRLAELGIVLPDFPAPIAHYVVSVRDGNVLYLSGAGPKAVDGTNRRGKVGLDTTVEQAYGDARLTGLNLIAALIPALGDNWRVRRITKLLGMVNAVPEFQEHPQVINGCSDLMHEVFGEAGQHARSAIGVGSLPFGITVEIEAIVALESV